MTLQHSLTHVPTCSGRVWHSRWHCAACPLVGQQVERPVACVEMAPWLDKFGLSQTHKHTHQEALRHSGRSTDPEVNGGTCVLELTASDHVSLGKSLT